MELSGKEWDAEEADKFAEYEMNVVLDLLDIREWVRRSPGADEWDMPSDDPLGAIRRRLWLPFWTAVWK
ncbi:MAG: hypothetical protein K2O97_06790 [Acetatifactor sp.]|nr:hypothetical protein [Acetatifactor sp.]